MTYKDIFSQSVSVSTSPVSSLQYASMYSSARAITLRIGSGQFGNASLHGLWSVRHIVHAPEIYLHGL